MGNRYKSPQGLGRLSGPALSPSPPPLPLSLPLSFSFSVSFFPLGAEGRTINAFLLRSAPPLSCLTATSFLNAFREWPKKAPSRRKRGRIILFIESLDLSFSSRIGRENAYRKKDQFRKWGETHPLSPSRSLIFARHETRKWGILESMVENRKPRVLSRNRAH